MKVSARISLAVVTAILLVAACSDGPRVIPRSKMEKICADMLVADEWMETHSPVRRAIDTSLFYEPIFRKYGYTTDDYRASLEYYMRDPLKMARMMKKVALKLEAEAARLQNSAEVEAQAEAAAEEENEEE